MQWLLDSSAEPTARPMKKIIQDVVGDGTWFSSSDVVKFWIESNSSTILRCHGDAGVGKVSIDALHGIFQCKKFTLPMTTSI